MHDGMNEGVLVGRGEPMAKIEDLKLGTEVVFFFTDGTARDGKITGRLMAGVLEGYVDPINPTESLEKKLSLTDRVKVTFPTIGVPPETISVSCAPEAVRLLYPPTGERI